MTKNKYKKKYEETFITFTFRDVFVFRFSGEGAWYMYQSQGIASLSDRTTWQY